MKKVVSLVLIALVVLVAGCSRPWFGLGRKAAHVSPAADTESGQKQASTEDGRRVVAAAALDELIRLREAPQQKADAGKVRSALEGAIPVSVRGGVREPNHQRYLGEPMVFSPLPPDPYPGQKIAVAAADGMQLYTDSLAPLAGRREKILALIASDGLVPVTAIPVGTVLPLLGVYQDKGGTEGEEGWYDGLFRYRNDLNWFYLTEYKGTRGIVWGAGLRGAILRRPQKQYSGPFDEEIRTLDSAEVMRLSYYYTKPRKGAVWVPFIGSRQIDGEAAKSLEKNRIFFEQTVFGRRNDYNLWIDQPDDLIALYLLQKEDPNAGGHPHRLDANPDSPLYDRNRGIPTFVTTDLVAHCLHLLFDRMLAQMEEERLFLGMARLVARLQAKALELPGGDAGTPAASASRLLRGYLSVAEALIRMAPVVPVDADSDERQGNGPTDAAVDRQALLAQYPDDVRQELELILAAGGLGVSPVMRTRLDYSQFKPRGHYTRTESLSAYFRAAQWLGQAAFDIDLRRTPPRDETMSDEDFTVLHGLAALLLNRMLIEDREALALWRGLSDPVTYLVGASDDIVPSDTVPLLAPLLPRDPSTWSTREKVLEILAAIAPKLRQPRIQGSLLVGGTVDGKAITQWTEQGDEQLMPVTFRLLGPRFTLDSWFFSMLSGHRIPGKVPRNMVRGLDVIALLGSRSAKALLRDEQARIPGYATAFELLEAQAPALARAASTESFYGGCLDLVGKLASFERGSAFYFTETPLWDTKSLITSHAAWAELRHDTILYSKQSAAERAGNGGWEPTFTTRDYPLQIHVIEPNLPFFYSLRGLLARLETRAREFIPHEYALKLADFAVIVDAMTGIVEKETLDQPITEEENSFILDIAGYLARIVIPPGSGEWVEDRDQLKMAVVADVHTDFMDNAVLEVATGMPYRITVALNDGQGGKRIAVGYTYSYYEFTRPVDGRLTDEEWKALVYPSSDWEAPATARAEVAERLRPWQPDWLRGKVP